MIVFENHLPAADGNRILTGNGTQNPFMRIVLKIIPKEGSDRRRGDRSGGRDSNGLLALIFKEKEIPGDTTATNQQENSDDDQENSDHVGASLWLRFWFWRLRLPVIIPRRETIHRWLKGTGCGCRWSIVHAWLRAGKTIIAS